MSSLEFQIRNQATSLLDKERGLALLFLSSLPLPVVLLSSAPPGTALLPRASAPLERETLSDSPLMTVSQLRERRRMKEREEEKEIDERRREQRSEKRGQLLALCQRHPRGKKTSPRPQTEKNANTGRQRPHHDRDTSSTDDDNTTTNRRRPPRRHGLLGLRGRRQARARGDARGLVRLRRPRGAAGARRRRGADARGGAGGRGQEREEGGALELREGEGSKRAGRRFEVV